MAKYVGVKYNHKKTYSLKWPIGFNVNIKYRQWYL